MQADCLVHMAHRHRHRTTRVCLHLERTLSRGEPPSHESSIWWVCTAQTVRRLLPNPTRTPSAARAMCCTEPVHVALLHTCEWPSRITPNEKNDPSYTAIIQEGSPQWLRVSFLRLEHAFDTGAVNLSTTRASRFGHAPLLRASARKLRPFADDWLPSRYSFSRDDLSPMQEASAPRPSSPILLWWSERSLRYLSLPFLMLAARAPTPSSPMRLRPRLSLSIFGIAPNAKARAMALAPLSPTLFPARLISVTWIRKVQT